MNIMTVSEVREALVIHCIQSISKDFELLKIYMRRSTFYKNESDDDVVNLYVNLYLPKVDVKDEEPIEVLTVTSNDGKDIKYKVMQHQQAFDILKV